VVGRGRVPRKIRANAQTEIKLLGTDDVWHPHRGAPFGNRRAWKTGRYNGQWLQLKREMRAFLKGLDTRIASIERRAGLGGGLAHRAATHTAVARSCTKGVGQRGSNAPGMDLRDQPNGARRGTAL